MTAIEKQNPATGPSSTKRKITPMDTRIKMKIE